MELGRNRLKQAVTPSVLNAWIDGVLRDALLLLEDDRIVFCNEAAERLWGYPKDAVLGQNQSILWMPADHDILNRAAEAARGQNVQIRRADGSFDTAVVSLESVQSEGRSYVIALLRGVTDLPNSHEQLRWLSLIINRSDCAIALLDEQRRVVHVNGAFTELFGYTQAEMVGRPPTEILVSERMNRDQLAFVRRKAWGIEGFHHEFLASDKLGRDLWVLVTNHPIVDADGVVRNIACVAVDITKQKELERLRQDVLEAIVGDISLRDIAAFLCRRVEALALGVVASFIRIDADNRLRPLAGPSLPREFIAAIDGVEIGPRQGSCGTAAFRGEAVEVTDIESDPLWAPYLGLGLPQELKACWSSPIKRRDGQVIGTFAFYYREKRGRNLWEDEIVAACLHLCLIAIERDETKQQLARVSRTDSLTGLPNRYRFQEDFPERLSQQRQSQTALFVLDLDHLDRVNETLGHAAGDKMVIEAAARLHRLFRADGAFYRLVSNSFLAILPESNADRASAMAEKMLAIMAEPLELFGVALELSATIGISLAPTNGRERDALVQFATAAMSQAKATQRGTYRFFSEEMDRLAQERLRLSVALRKAISDGALELKYQPQIDVRTGEIHGVEALARWSDPELGIISPGKFIPLAEEIGLIEALGEWSLDEACWQMAEWRGEGVSVPSVSVNISAPHFRNAGLPDFIRNLLDSYGLPPTCLTIEITESIMMDEETSALDTARAVRDLGVGLSLDDFGTGFSSLSRLPLLPLTELKIDRSFMRDLDNNASALSLMTAVIRIGQSLGLSVVTEGVETQEQYDRLAKLGGDIAQGYLFAQPLAPSALADWIASRRKRSVRISRTSRPKHSSRDARKVAQ